MGITLLVMALHVTGAFDNLENRAVDFRFKMRGTRPVNPSISVITIDEESISALGRWPWPRATHAKMISRLTSAGAKVIAFDTLFTEPDKSNPASDLELARAAKASGIVVSAFFFNGGVQHVFGREAVMPFSALRDNSEIGFVNLDPDKDGVTRRAPLYALEEVANEEYEIRPSLAVAAWSIATQKPLEELDLGLPAQVDRDTLDQVDTKIFINYAYEADKSYGYAYPFASYADVLSGKTPASEFKDKIVFIGATAAALYDLKAIPFANIYAGVMVHANIIDNLMAGEALRPVSVFSGLLYVLVVGLLLGVLLPRVSPWMKLVVFAVVVGGGIGIGLGAFNGFNLVIPMVPALFAGLGCYGGMLFYQLVVEEREKRKIKGSFKQYLSPKIIDIITKDPSKLKLGGDEREVSIFFLDIAGFTTMSEALKPTQLVEVMNECLTEFSHVILKHDGLINKYIGDCIMAFWNAPADQPNHASQACLAALDCIAALPAINKRFQEKGLPSIDCRIGINTGIVVVGNMGSHEKFDYTVMGDPVNLASRLEGANKQYHTHIMVSDVTFEKAQADIEARDLDLIRVKGKKEPKKVFEVLCKKADLTEEISAGRKKYHEGLALYRKKEFSEAIAVFEEVFNYLPNDYLTRVYLERARVFVSHPPPAGWDGVYEMTTK